MPEGKAPSVRVGGEWHLAHNWQRWCSEQVSEHMVRAWGRMIGTADDAGIGVALGRNLVCVDIDQEFLLDPIMAILPPSPVQKKGRKGISLFYFGDTEKIRSRNFRTPAPERAGLVDLLAEGKQTVLPPSIHPDTGEPYYWWSDETLADFYLEDLPELPEDIGERIGEVLRQFGYDPEAERPALVRGDAPAHNAHSAGASSIYRQANDDALADLHAWVPALCLYRCRTKPGGFCAEAMWRESSTGRPREVRKRNLSIVRKGIEDFGTGEKFTAIDLVMKARDCDKSTALNWLLERLPEDGPKIVLVHGPKTLERIRLRDHLSKNRK